MHNTLQLDLHSWSASKVDFQVAGSRLIIFLTVGGWGYFIHNMGLSENVGYIPNEIAI